MAVAEILLILLIVSVGAAYLWVLPRRRRWNVERNADAIRQELGRDLPASTEEE